MEAQNSDHMSVKNDGHLLQNLLNFDYHNRKHQYYSKQEEHGKTDKSYGHIQN